MRVPTSITEIEIENDDGRMIDSLRVTCTKCGHSVDIFGTELKSAKRGAATLHETCPEELNNRYQVDWS